MDAGTVSLSSKLWLIDVKLNVCCLRPSYTCCTGGPLPQRQSFGPSFILRLASAADIGGSGDDPAGELPMFRSKPVQKFSTQSEIYPFPHLAYVYLRLATPMTAAVGHTTPPLVPSIGSADDSLLSSDPAAAMATADSSGL